MVARVRQVHFIKKKNETSELLFCQFKKMQQFARGDGDNAERNL